jgi:glyoxylase-like metal-dependent hydrolase (beta-lactamase superfamily II)
MNRLAPLAALLLAAPAITAPVATEPAAQTITLGGVRFTALRDALNVVPNDGSVFGTDVGPAAVAGALRAAGQPTERVTLSVDALLVRMNGRTVLIDTGLGPRAGGVLMRSLAMAGVAPGQVTDVLVTHGHPDHLGGLVTAEGRSAFPQATIRLSAPEWASVQGKPELRPLVAAVRAQVRPFRPGGAVLPGIAAVALPGHTPGHSGYRIRTAGGTLTDTGDTAHSAVLSLAHPAWAIQYDGDQAAGRARREAELAQLAASGERVFAPHFPFPGFGRVVRAGQGYRWQPLS